MRLDHLIADAPREAAGVEIINVAYDNRRVTPGTLFFCVPGMTRDGHEFADGDLITYAVCYYYVVLEELEIRRVVWHSARYDTAPSTWRSLRA